jgi:hypothetical protein
VYTHNSGVSFPKTWKPFFWHNHQEGWVSICLCVWGSGWRRQITSVIATLKTQLTNHIYIDQALLIFHFHTSVDQYAITLHLHPLFKKSSHFVQMRVQLTLDCFSVLLVLCTFLILSLGTSRRKTGSWTINMHQWICMLYYIHKILTISPSRNVILSPCHDKKTDT